MALLDPAVLRPASLPPKASLQQPYAPPPTPVEGIINTPHKAELAATGTGYVSLQKVGLLPPASPALFPVKDDPITLHVLDKTTAQPAVGLRATLISEVSGGMESLIGKHKITTYTSVTDRDGRITHWNSVGEALLAVFNEHVGIGAKRKWTLRLGSEKYWKSHGKDTCIPEIDFVFCMDSTHDGQVEDRGRISIVMGQWGFTASKGH